MGRSIMIQGTMSSAGKSVVTAGLCRVFRQDGLSVAPFKSQNMALNSFVTRDGKEIGRAQAVQAEAAGVEPDVRMNPILLKPCSDMTSQVIVNGEAVQDMPAGDYFAYKKRLRPVVLDAFCSLAAAHDVVVIEGAGSPVEINLNADDIVNMGMAEMADAPVLLVADIDRGGMFAAIYGTVMLLDPEQRRRIRGVIVNKFRGEVGLLEPGLAQIEALTGVPVLGVIPYLPLDIDDEDSVTERFSRVHAPAPLDIAVIRFPHISNATDMDALDRLPPVGLRYVTERAKLGAPDAIILPGTKSTMSDLFWLRRSGLEAAIRRLAAAGTPIVGICGGYQMLGKAIYDPDGVERGGRMYGMGLLPVRTVFRRRKTLTRVTGVVQPLSGTFAALSDTAFSGYEIHMGRTVPTRGTQAFSRLAEGGSDGAVHGNVLGTYVHGLFDGALGTRLAALLLEQKGLTAEAQQLVAPDAAAYRERQFDLLADALRAHLDMERIYRILNGEDT